MSEKIEQLLEKQNELLERIANSFDEQRDEINELVKINYLLVVSQTNRAGFPKSALEYARGKIAESFD